MIYLVKSGLSGHTFLSVVRFSHKKPAVTSARQPPRQNDMVLVFDVDDNLITTDWKRARLPQATFASSLASHLTPCRDPPAVPPPQLRLRPASRPFRPAPHADRGETDPTNTGGSPPVRGCLMAASSRRHRVGCARRGSGGHRGGAPSSASVGVDGCTTRFPRRGDGRGRGRRGVGPAPTGAASRVESPPPDCAG